MLFTDTEAETDQLYSVSYGIVKIIVAKAERPNHLRKKNSFSKLSQSEPSRLKLFYRLQKCDVPCPFFVAALKLWIQRRASSLTLSCLSLFDMCKNKTVHRHPS